MSASTEIEIYDVRVQLTSNSVYVSFMCTYVHTYTNRIYEIASTYMYLWVDTFYVSIYTVTTASAVTGWKPPAASLTD